MVETSIMEFKFAFFTMLKNLNDGSVVITLDFYATLLCICIVLLIGTVITNKSKFLYKYDIPVPVTGGLIAAILFFVLDVTFGVRFAFESSIKDPFMLMFFTSVGLGADFASLKKGGRLLVLFGIAVCCFLFVQNFIGVAVMSVMGENPLLGLLAGSITLSGGHGTGAAWSDVFMQPPYNFMAAKEIAMASATYGLIAGGLLGGPVAQHLIRKFSLKPTEKNYEGTVSDEVFSEPGKQRLITSESFVKSLGLFAFAMFIGTTISYMTKGTAITLPTFVWCLFSGIIIRNLFSYLNIHQIFDREVGVIGNVSLSLFLAMAIMTLNLVELTKLAVPLTVLLAIQTVAIILYVRYVTFKICGSDYNAACMVAGHCGFGMGATPTAIANLQAVTNHFGPSRISFIIVPVMGGFFVDIANALVLKLFLFLPMFG
ncbi:sodium/glutamate symporter [Campylobacter geochelonis]|uniref:Sodium/glutamate symporter n=2 Tax=Campylobacter geochelonis TaxID=1780362 RepID=A0A128ELM4_9BACT|nr:sodium:glutamate symport carrier protein [Campylobacter geochelonis]CZE46843.1 sodium/glutamate symporter [Campylobacter geochelonis]CZE49868.1 sodium/glutamate symporter [Campylobacter geochelonis]